MKNNRDNRQEWQKADNLFVESDWQEVPEGSTWKGQKQYIEAFIS